MMRWSFVVGMFLASSAIAQVPPRTAEEAASAQGDLAITIYDNDQALVQDVRSLAIPAGRSRIEFPDVSTRIRPETLSFAAAGTGIVEQNFDFDLLSPESLMAKAIGQQITLVRTNPATGAETRERATVLSTAGGVVVRIGDRIEILRDDGLPVRAVFDRVPANLRARSTLSVTVDSRQSGTRAASIRYLTPGLKWSADYVALYDEAQGRIALQGWVTLDNQTGTTFRHAATTLVAGSPGTPGEIPYSQMGGAGLVRAGTEAGKRDRIGDYYLYPLPAPTTIANAQTKQVSFLDVAGVAAAKVYGRTVGWLQSDNQPVNVQSQVGFSTARDAGLGDALPAGTVRFYQRDRTGTPQFVGEAQIGHTPAGSELLLTTGNAFDVLVKATVVKREKITADEWAATERFRVVRGGQVDQVDVQQAKEFYRTTMRYELTNAKPQAVTVKLVQAGLDHGWTSRDYRIIDETIAGEQVDADRRRWAVPVPANGKTELTVVMATRY